MASTYTGKIICSVSPSPFFPSEKKSLNRPTSVFWFFVDHDIHETVACKYFFPILLDHSYPLPPPHYRPPVSMTKIVLSFSFFHHSEVFFFFFFHFIYRSSLLGWIYGTTRRTSQPSFAMHTSTNAGQFTTNGFATDCSASLSSGRVLTRSCTLATSSSAFAFRPVVPGFYMATAISFTAKNADACGSGEPGEKERERNRERGS